MDVIRLIVGLLILASPCSAADTSGYFELREAREHLLRAGEYLQSLPDDSGGEKFRAIGSIDDALRSVHYLMQGGSKPGTRDYRMEEREEKLERKREEREEQLERKREERERRLWLKDLQRRERIENR